MALTKVTGQVINSTTDLSVGVATVGGGTSTGDLYVVGVTTFSGDVSVGGTLTYEDVTNIDSVGLITARNGINVIGAGVTIRAGGLNVTSGVSTFSGNVKVGSGITLSPDGDVHTTGVSTFTGNVNATGNVLIGGPSHTSRPLVVHAATNSVVSIEGNSDGTSSIMLGDNDDEDVGMIQYNHADNDLAFTVNTAEALAIKSDGQLVSSGTGAELNLTNTGSTATETTGYFYTSASGIHNVLQIKTSTNNGGDPYIKFDGGGQDMIVGERYAGTTNNLLVLGPGNNPDTTSGIFVKGTGLVGVGTDGPSTILHVQANTGDMLRLDRNNTGAVGNQIAFRHSNATGTLEETGSINCVSTANAATGELRFYTRPSGGTNSQRMTITSAGLVEIKGSGEGGPHVYRDGGNGPDIVLSGCRGTIASPTTSAGTDVLGNINFQGYDGSGYHRRASINGHIDGTVVDGSNTLPTAMIFKTGTTSTVERMRISSSGAITMPTQIRFLARAGTDGDGQTVSPYTFSTEVFDEGGCYDGTNKFTAPVAGVYFFSVHAGYKQTGQNFGTRIRRYNSSNAQQEEYELFRLISTDDPDSHSGGAGSCIMNCAVGDYVQCFPQATPYHTNGTLCFFCGYLLG